MDKLLQNSVLGLKWTFVKKLWVADLLLQNGVLGFKNTILSPQNAKQNGPKMVVLNRDFIDE